MKTANLQEKASQSLSKGEYNEAIALYEQCIEANPYEVMNYWQLGLATLLQGDEVTAQAIWMSVLLQGSPEANDALLANLVQILYTALVIQFDAGSFQGAENICKNILNFNESIPEVYYYMGSCLKQRNEITEAIKCMKKAIDLSPNFAEAYCAVGGYIRDRHWGEYDLAINYLQKAIELKPNYATAYLYVGVCFHDKGEYDEAMNYLSKVLDIQHDSAEAYYYMGLCLKNKGYFEEALEKLQQAILIQPDLRDAVRAIEELVKCEESGYAPQVRQGYYIWDAILFKDDNLYRLFYLMGDSKASPFWSVGEVGAAISYDLKKWEYIGVVLKPDPDSEWQSGRILGGSVYKENGIYYFFYSASPPKPLIFHENIGIATSTDGIVWQRCSLPIIKLDTSATGYYSYGLRNLRGVNIHFACRDPYLLKDSKTNNYYLFIVSSSKGKNLEYSGCIGLAVSSKIDSQYKVLPPVLYPTIPGTDEGIHYELERPQVIYREGKYHLFFSCGTRCINPNWIKKVGREGITESSLYWYVSENITGPFVPSSAKPIVKGSERTGLYGTSFIEAPNGELIACGASMLTHTLEVSPRFPVRWENGNIEIIVE